MQQYVRNLYGLTDKDPRRLAVLGRSWDQPARLTFQGERFSSDGYDKNQRAYVLAYTGTNKPGPLSLEVQASDESPVVNLALIIENWGKHQAHLSINDQPLTDGDEFRVGYRRGREGVDLIAWIEIESVKRLQVSITSK